MTDDLAARLLQAQIAFHKRQLLDPESLRELIVDEVDHFLDATAQLTLTQAVDADVIKATAHKYAVQMPVEGAVPELVGEVAGRLYRHEINAEIRLSEVIDTRRGDELLDMVVEMDVVHRVLREVLASPVTVEAMVDIVSHAVDAAVTGHRVPDAEAGLGPRVLGGLLRAAGPARGLVDRGVQVVTRGGARFVLDAAGEESDEALLETVRQIWREHAGDSVASLRELVDADDVEDAVVVAFEFWKSFRDTDYFRTLLDEGVAQVFDKYGDTPIAELLTDLGVGREDMIEEGLRFGPPVLAVVDRRGLLDDLLRRRLQPFYESAEFRSALDPEPTAER